MKRFLHWLALACALILFLWSLLVFFSAPTAMLWIAAILIGEWGHYVAIGALVLVALSWRTNRLAAVIALVAAAFSLYPSARAMMIARRLPARCTSAFGKATNEKARTTPFNAIDLIRGISLDGVEVSEQVYATEGAKDLSLDLYRAKEIAAPQPLVIVVHGGSWNGGNKEQLPALNRHLAREGYCVAAINYRHAPKFRSPAAVDDLFHALDFLKANAERFHIDVTRIALIGRSAGGQIALSAAYAGRDPHIRGVVGFYAPSDLVLGYKNPSRPGVLDSRNVLEEYLGGSPNEQSQAYAAASPINFVNAATPPTLLIHGLLDPIVWPRQSEQLTERLQQANRPHLFLALPWATHGCDANLNGPSGQLSTYAIDRFLAAIFAARDNTGRVYFLKTSAALAR